MATEEENNRRTHRRDIAVGCTAGYTYRLASPVPVDTTVVVEVLLDEASLDVVEAVVVEPVMT